MSLYMVALGSALIVSIVWIVIIGNQFQNWHERCETLKAQVFGLEQDLIHEREGQTRPLYELRSDGIDAVVVRSRPDLSPPRKSTLSGLSGDAEVYDLTNVEDE